MQIKIFKAKKKKKMNIWIIKQNPRLLKLSNVMKNQSQRFELQKIPEIKMQCIYKKDINNNNNKRLDFGEEYMKRLNFF